MDVMLERYAGQVASAMAAGLGGRLVGVYLHGSAVLGGFDARRSDVDILVVSEGSMTAAERSAAAEALRDERLPCPAHGLELSIVTLPVARNPTACLAFELHVTTAPDDSKVVDGHGHEGDPDLVLGFAVCRQAGRLFGPGRPASEVFGPVADDLVLAQLAHELRWGTEHALGEYAVLNACRAWRFTVDRVLVSKLDGGLWALGRTSVPDRELIQTALDRQRCLPAADLDPAAVQRFVDQVMSRLTRASAMP
ncbi:aminoglycoside adenylyltransferase domain-containing protein [Spongiactinospora sp. 9N601]|uniref:aminoglycoside adenylyltransferase domain-containing protein n=1 Tax=Spongiactinospora sp. 9N601 TaxID=3375149 RepID=UPI0037B0FC67